MRLDSMGPPGQAAAPPSALTAPRLEALHAAASALLEAEPTQALALAREGWDLAQAEGGPAARAGSVLLLGRALLVNGALPEAREHLQAARALYHTLDDALGQASAEELAGKVCLNLGALEDAEELLCAAIERVRGNAAPAAHAVRATALNHLAGVQHMQGRSAEALVSLQGALGIWEAQAQFSGQVHCLSNIGIIQSALGQYPEAVSSLSSAYTLYQAHLNDPRSETFILNNLALVHHLKGDNGLAIEVMQSSCVAADATQDGVIRASTLLNLGTFCLEAEQYDRALGHLGAALTLSREAGYRVGELSTLDSLGLLHQRTGAPLLAREAHQQALDIALEIGDTQGELEARLHLGRLHLGTGDLDAARPELCAALELARQVHSPKEESEVHQALASVYEAQGDYPLALEHFTELRRIERALFDTERDRQTRNLSIQFEVERARHDATVYKLRTEVEQEARRTAERLVRERTSELARAQHEVVTRLAMAAEYRDDTTGEHTRRVGRAAARIALALGWSEQRAGVLGIAARLHDVGKIGIPDTVLLKPGRLDDEQYAQMRTHTLIGARILSGGRSELLRLAEEVALTHHERWDGQGYPRGLTGEQIPLSGRIVAVADVFDALTQARPYKRAWTAQEALHEIRRQSGQQFDPRVVEAALEILAAPQVVPTDLPGGLSAEAFSPDDLPLAQEDATHMLSVFEQLLVERTRELELARQEAERTAQDMQRMALTDSMTGLGNRRAFEADLEVTLAAARAQSGELSVLSFDLDGLKAVNDSRGHDQGDQFLQTFGQGLAAEFAPVGRAYRIGGDEFAVILVGPQDDRVWSARLHATLALVQARGFPAAGASSGAARFPQDAQSAGDLLRVSDRRMYQNKLLRRSGRSGEAEGGSGQAGR